MKYEISIPIPPSTNKLYRNVSRKGRVKTTQYKSWLSEALWLLKSGLPTLTPPVKLGVTIYGGKGFSVDSDISNRMKAAEDALVAAGRLENDNVKFVIECRQRYFPPEKGDHARCVLTIVDGDQLPRRRHGANDGPNTFYGPTNVEA